MKMRKVGAIAALSLAAVADAAAISVSISNVSYPTSFAWDGAGRVYASEKSGRVKRASSWAATAFDQVVLDLSSVVRRTCM